MDGPKFSIVIPYKQRPDYIRIALSALADQTMDKSEFEVIVGAMEYEPQYVALCREFTDRLNLVSVLSAEPWNAARARNLAMRHASGQVLVTLDADMALPARSLEHLYERYFRRGENICVLGQMVGYDPLAERGSVVLSPYSDYRKILADLDAARDVREDERWRLDAVQLPWTLVWTGMVALPTALVREHGLELDEGFQGWGAEDQEWGLRIALTGTPIVLGQDVYGLHLPHVRNISENFEAQRANKRRLLAKWPILAVEAPFGLGLAEANRSYLNIERELAGYTARTGRTLGVARGSADGADLLVMGVEFDGTSRMVDPALHATFDDPSAVEVLPLVGLAVPYPDRSVGECRVLPPVMRLSALCRDAVLREAARVSCSPVSPPALDRADADYPAARS